MTDDPSAMDDASFAVAQSADEGPLHGAPTLDDDADGVVDAHEDLGQAGNAPDEGPAAPPPFPQP